jgi:putative membrane protein
MKIFTYVAGLIGLIVATAVVARQNFGEVTHVLGIAGWGLLWLVPFHVLPLWLDTLAWRILLTPRDPERRAPTHYLLWVATIREAANRLLPVANVGGEVIGIRLVLLRKLDGAAVTASVIIEVLLTLINQYLFTALGLVVLIVLTQATELTWTILLGLGLSLPLPFLLGAMLRYGSVFERMERFIERLLGDRSKLAALLGGSSLDAEIKALYSHHGRLVMALLWQLAGYILGSFETWLALRLLGHEVTPWTAMVVEAMTQAVRHFIFFVPAGIGVQEAGLVIFGQMVGIGNEVAVALSLAKRMREVLFGVPALLSWQWAEGRRLHRSFLGRRGSDASS